MRQLKINNAVVLEQNNNCLTTVEEITNLLDKTLNYFKHSLKNSGKHLLLDTFLKEGRNSTLYHVSKTANLPKTDKDK